MPKSKIEEGEFAVRLTSDIKGGHGDHSKGAVLRRLTQASYTSLTGAGFGDGIPAGTEVDDGDVEAAPATATSDADAQPNTDAPKGGTKK